MGSEEPWRILKIPGKYLHINIYFYIVFRKVDWQSYFTFVEYAKQLFSGPSLAPAAPELFEGYKAKRKIVCKISKFLLVSKKFNARTLKILMRALTFLVLLHEYYSSTLKMTKIIFKPFEVIVQNRWHEACTLIIALFLILDHGQEFRRDSPPKYPFDLKTVFDGEKR